MPGRKPAQRAAIFVGDSGILLGTTGPAIEVSRTLLGAGRARADQEVEIRGLDDRAQTLSGQCPCSTAWTCLLAQPAEAMFCHHASDGVSRM